MLNRAIYVHVSTDPRGYRIQLQLKDGLFFILYRMNFYVATIANILYWCWISLMKSLVRKRQNTRFPRWGVITPLPSKIV
jgi:hypothetical protein